MSEAPELEPQQPDTETEFLVDTYLQKPWSVCYSFDPETKQYEVWVPELNVGTMGSTRLEAGWQLEDALAVYFDACVGAGSLDQLAEPRVGGRPVDEETKQ